MRGRRVEAEDEHLEGTTLAHSLGGRHPSEQGPRRARERVHDLERCGAAEVTGVEVHEREVAGEVPPPRGERAGADRLAQVEALEDVEEEVVGEGADSVLADVAGVALGRRRLHGPDRLTETLARINAPQAAASCSRSRLPHLVPATRSGGEARREVGGAARGIPGAPVPGDGDGERVRGVRAAAPRGLGGRPGEGDRGGEEPGEAEEEAGRGDGRRGEEAAERGAAGAAVGGDLVGVGEGREGEKR